MEDPRALNVGTRWVFWVIGDELGRYADHRALDPHGLIYRGCNVSIYAKTWAQVLDDNRARLQYLQNKLEIDVDKAMSIKYLQDLTSTLSSTAPA